VHNNPLEAVDADGHDYGQMYAQYAEGNAMSAEFVGESMMQHEFIAAATAANGLGDDHGGNGGDGGGGGQAQPQTPKPGRQPDGSYIAPTGSGSEIGKITDPASPLPPMIGNGQCVTACAHFSGVTARTKQWTEGAAVANNGSIPIGTAIATFGSNGRYPTSGDQNSGIYMGQGKNGSILILDQWPAHPVSGTPARPAQIREMRLDDGRTLSNSAQAYHVIIVPR
jgi:hypothetical protein